MDRQEIAGICERIHKQSFAVVDSFTRDQMAEMNTHLLAAPVYIDAHIPETARAQNRRLINRAGALMNECICVPTPAVIVAPHLIEKALELTDVAAAYLGRDPPVGYSMNAFWTRPGPGELRGDIQAFHEDKDDERFLVMFVYLTDIHRDKDGPHQIKSQDGSINTIYGPAGTVFLADTSRAHRGLKPTEQERGIAWFRWGVSDRPPANLWDKNEPIDHRLLGDRYPSDPRLRESIKLIAR